MADVGRKAKVTRKKYLDAVKIKRTNKDIIIAQHLGVHRSNISRFRKNNPDVVEKAEKILMEFTSIVFDAKNLTFETYEQIPIIVKWDGIMEARPVSSGQRKDRIRSLYNVCRYLNIHPENLTLENCGELCSKAKKAYYADKKFITGLAYLSIRKPLRSWFMLMHGVSGEYLSTLGMSAESSKGVGSASKEKVLEEQRRIFDKVLKDCVYEIINTPRFKRFHQFKGLEEIIYLELKGITHFMYYTATRIGATNPDKQGSLSVRLNNNKHSLSKRLWKINLMDKGEKGGLEWNKMLMDDGLKKMKEYVSERFNIPFDELETNMKNVDSYLFPYLHNHYDLERYIMKLALAKSGVITRNPNHIWRHTFAQDCLHATDWNYELTASLGGWMDTGTLKKHYGEMSEEAKERGLLRAMGFEPEDVKYELRW